MSQEDETTRAARRDLKRLAEEGNLSASPLLKGTADSLKSHFTAADADQKDASEVWGTRIGRGLAVIAVLVLGVWLYFEVFQ
ncbi:hypothetical protein [Pseudohoeflea coraliihabitans]|uniref:DUF3618 domain-containing protein n=1 Tax=Pseudohoeflea coraliihabitans TaxID=2860393 RepID=A0ABS6WT97_9HYPH|nr:hypothetical protein [Pseudohoeflea sp. DP4N28-3]MBW3099178.1 hypothetical protein [Pseudohoeflea sp. DP4N28-3]